MKRKLKSVEKAGRLIALAGMLAVATTLAAGIPGLKVPSLSDLKSLPGKMKKTKDESPEEHAEHAPKAKGREASPLVEIPELPPGAGVPFPAGGAGGFVAVDPAKQEQQRLKRANQLQADLKTIGDISGIPDAGSSEFDALRRTAWGILERRYMASRGRLETDTVEELEATVDWIPAFDVGSRTVSPADQERAREVSNTVAQFATYLDRPHYIVAYATAICSLDPRNFTSIQNAACAILSSADRLYRKNNDKEAMVAARQDAEALYRYVLACNPGKEESGAATTMDSLISLGNLYIEMGDATRARLVLGNAWRVAPQSWDVALAFASYYEMVSKPDLARAVLEDKRVAVPAMYATFARGSKNLIETQKASELSPVSSEQQIEAELEKLQQLETITAADYVDVLDDESARAARRFVDTLAAKGSYRAPGIDGLSQYSTARSINTPSGMESLSDFAEKLDVYMQGLLALGLQQSHDALGWLGMSVQYNIDVKDAMANPEKYRNREITATVSGADQARARAEEQKRLALQARADLDKGKTDTLVHMAAQHSPEVAIFALKPHDFANPTDVLIQQYNISLLARKFQAYNAYFFSANAKTRKSLQEIERLYKTKFIALQGQEEAELAALYKRYAKSSIDRRELTLKEHSIHKTYAAHYNKTVEHVWNEATQSAGIAYDHKIKPKAEQFYYDVFRNVALISDPVVRAKKHEELSRFLHYAVYEGMANVLRAYGSYGHVEEWDCHCDIGSLVALADQEQKELDRSEEARMARAQKERLRFESGDIPESSALFKRLDAYGTDLDIPFIPFMSGRISQARTVLNFNGKLPTKYSPQFEYKFTENAFTGATTHGAGVTVGIKGSLGAAKTNATVSVKGAVAIDGKGVVSDYSVLAVGKASVEAGGAGAGAGGEVGYSSKTGFTVDRVVNVKASFSNDFGGSAEVSYESSARRGNTFSVKAEQEFNPFKDQMNKGLTEAIKESMGEDLSKLMAIDTSVTKELWSGSFTF